ncbi:hypothetical protein BT93_D0683 [Corymbia citriodora subsp. variegata]|nr:hypothetical protein BT93_D0683 [Corymbia citriodora subsp. variegata]
MDPVLQQAIENDDVDELHRLIVEDRKLLDRVSNDPFPNTPLHIAAAVEKTQVAMEVAILKPLFARKLDLEGYSPMHLALQHEHFYIVRALITLNTELIQKEGDNELELLAEFLYACRSSIKDLTSQCETAVHIAVKNHNIKVFKVLFGWLKLVCLTRILDWKDKYGNTVLHIAVSEKQPEVIKLLIGHTNVNARNLLDKTALEIFQVNPCGGQDVAKRLRRQGCRARLFTPTLSLSQAFSVGKFIPVSSIRGEATCNITLIVPTLITTATYQAALNPLANSPVVIANSSDISIGKPHQAANLVLSGSKLYYFAYVNTATFLISVSIIWAMAIPLLPGSLWVCISLTYLGLAYFYPLVSEFPKSNDVPTALLACF